MMRALFASVAAVLVCAGVPASASAVEYAFNVRGESGEGKLAPEDGGYELKGTFVDAVSGKRVHLRGTLTEVTTGFTTCPLRGFVGPILCFLTPEEFRCNILSPEITFALDAARATAGPGDAGRFVSRRVSSICLTDTPGVLTFQIYLMDAVVGPVFSFGWLFGTAEWRGNKFDVSFVHPFGVGSAIGYELAIPPSP